MTDSRGAVHDRNGVSRLDTLTSRRFLAALEIVVHHSRGTFDSGVSFFFVLSGFVLAYGYQSICGRNDISRFLIARVARVWPGYLASFAGRKLKAF